MLNIVQSGCVYVESLLTKHVTGIKKTFLLLNLISTLELTNRYIIKTSCNISNIYFAILTSVRGKCHVDYLRNMCMYFNDEPFHLGLFDRLLKKTKT